jgi:glycine reductase complex component B subunit alpha and beta
MKLHIETINIKDVQIGPKTSVSDHVLHLDFLELHEMILKDNRIGSVDINIVSPGDQVRIVNLVDVIQPRCKIDREGVDFPGWVGNLTIAGQGRTRSLRNIAVVLSNSASKRPYSSVIDMFGLGLELSRYAKMKILSINPLPSAGVEERDFDNAIKLAGLKTAVYLAKAAEGHHIDETEIFELDVPHQSKSNLPKIVYYHMLHTPQHDYEGVGDPILYGASVTNILPTIIHPNEIIDGGVVNTYTLRGMETYALQNHAIIKELYKRHEKDLIFLGVIVGVACVEPVQRQRTCIMVANLAANVLGANGVVLNKVQGGMPHVDLGLTGEECEKFGVKTTLFIDMWQSTGSLSECVLFNSEFLPAIVNRGNMNEKIRLHRAATILGGTEETSIFNPNFKQKAGDEFIEVEAFLLSGFYSYTGEAQITAGQY